MKRKIGLLAAAIVIILAVSLVYSYWESLPYASYKIGDEIKGFPVDGISMTINNFSTSPDLTFPESSKDIFLNVTLRNLSGHSVYFNHDESASKYLDLKFVTEKGVGEASAWNYTSNWVITLFDIQKNEITSITLNESANGTIRFVLGNVTYSSLELICRSISQQKPLFIVNLT
jgi:hypothetical protein